MQQGRGGTGREDRHTDEQHPKLERNEAINQSNGNEREKKRRPNSFSSGV